jgi:hypothetical protein
MLTPDTLLAQLASLGILKSKAIEIARDVDNDDARSLYSELVLRGLWNLVVDESNPSELSRLGSPGIDRLLKSGINPDDLLDAIRETQVSLIYNVAHLLDWPTETQGLEDELQPELSVRFRERESTPLPVYEFHSNLEALDPTGRGGAPRSLDLRHFQALPVNARSELIELIRNKKFSAAALKWKLHVGGELQICLNAVRTLHLWLNAMKA